MFWLRLLLRRKAAMDVALVSLLFSIVLVGEYNGGFEYAKVLLFFLLNLSYR